MAFTTFSGPIRSGTVREGATRNTGLVLLTQSTTIAATNAKTSGAAQVDLGVLPAGSKILRFNVNVLSTVSGNNASTISIVIGNSADDDKYLVSTDVGQFVGAVPPDYLAENFQPVACNDVGSTDVPLKALLTSADGDPTAGSIDVTVEYVQRNSDGAQNPVSV